MNISGYYESLPSLLLVGRSGNGKTSCKRSIDKVTNDNKKVIAVECDYVGDTGEDREVDIETVMENVERAVTECNEKGELKAVVLVLKYGVRFTKQEKDAVEVVKYIFGIDVFIKHGIILMTYGDLFGMDYEDDESRLFEFWCWNQTGDIQKLFQEVNYRIVLFDNRTENEWKGRKQFETLFNFVNGIHVTYTVDQLLQPPQGKKDRVVNLHKERVVNLQSESRGRDEDKSLIACVCMLFIALVAMFFLYFCLIIIFNPNAIFQLILWFFNLVMYVTRNDTLHEHQP